jgi:hypothetical protein
MFAGRPSGFFTNAASSRCLERLDSFALIHRQRSGEVPYGPFHCIGTVIVL